MADVDAAIRTKLAQLDEYDPMFDQRQISNATDGIRSALLALVAEHEAKHRRLGQPHEDHTQEGLPLCQGWPYRPHADSLCRHIRTVADALGIRRMRADCMARRNLRHWAEAKKRRGQQYADPRGHWSYALGAPIFLEDAPFGTYCAPTIFLPMDGESSIAGPAGIFPDGIGEVLHALLNPEPRPGPPYTHTLNWPPTEYDDNGEPLPPKIEPSMTIVRPIQAEALGVYDTVGRLPLYRIELHPLLLDHGIDRTLADLRD